MQDTVAYIDGIGYCTDLAALPNRRELMPIYTVRDLWNAVASGRLMGSVAVSAAAAILMRSSAESDRDSSKQSHIYDLKMKAKALYAMQSEDRLLQSVAKRFIDICDDGRHTANTVDKTIADECSRVTRELIDTSCNIGSFGFDCIKDKKSVLTIGDAGTLTAVKYGTALAPVYIANEQGAKLGVYCARGYADHDRCFLTDYELSENGISHTVVADSDIAKVMSEGKIEAVLAAISSDGGVLQAAICAKHYKIPFYICAPHIIAESGYGIDRRLITAVITEHGIFGS